jgi:hypothetical protein
MQRIAYVVDGQVETCTTKVSQRIATFRLRLGYHQKMKKNPLEHPYLSKV